MFDTAVDVLVQLAATGWFPLMLLAVAAADALVPVVPSETLMIVGGAAAALDDQRLVVIVLCGAAGALAGDALSFQLGAATGRALKRRSSARGARRLAWATTELRRRGGLLLLTARFVPGGRTAVTLAAGATGQPTRWFLGWEVVAVLLWASYAAGLGFVFGRAFADDHATAFLAAFAAASVLAAAGEVRRRRRNPATTEDPEECPDPVA